MITDTFNCARTKWLACVIVARSEKPLTEKTRLALTKAERAYIAAHFQFRQIPSYAPKVAPKFKRMPSAANFPSYPISGDTYRAA